MGGKLTNVDAEIGHVGGKPVTDNSSFNPQGPNCCSPRGPCSRWPVIAFIQAKETRLNTAPFIVMVGVCLVLVVGLCASILYVWVHEN